MMNLPGEGRRTKRGGGASQNIPKLVFGVELVGGRGGRRVPGRGRRRDPIRRESNEPGNLQKSDFAWGGASPDREKRIDGEI